MILLMIDDVNIFRIPAAKMAGTSGWMTELDMFSITTKSVPTISVIFDRDKTLSRARGAARVDIFISQDRLRERPKCVDLQCR